eukprot:9239372-Pyramimonas_sp.AAC.1
MHGKGTSERRQVTLKSDYTDPPVFPQPRVLGLTPAKPHAHPGARAHTHSYSGTRAQARPRSGTL